MNAPKPKIWRPPSSLQDWRAVLDKPEGERWHPLILDRAQPPGAEIMDELIARGEVVFVHDTIGAQIRDLLKARTPSRPWTDAELDAEVENFLGGQDLRDYGRWVYYPWSRRLVHVIPPAEFAELRSDRNRVKITPAEQAKLMRLKVGIAGLSVGNAIAVTLALEGLFGELRLADFDTLDLSNMNRLRCTIDQIGLNKAVIAARQIFEMNPYAGLTLFPEGVTLDNVEAFFDDGGRLDICIDECDSIHVKFKLREEARARKIPVLMETSDRGMLDVERFDLEPTRSILHGLVGDLTSDQIQNLSPPARVGLILKMIGESTMSPRLAASFLEFGRTLRGFSQLGSDVTLGGATTATAVRRLGLGLPLASGRVYIDVSAQLANIQSPPAAVDFERLKRTHREREFITSIVEYAAMAPSEGNMQPWRFRWANQALDVYRDVERSGGPDDEFGRFTALVAIGAALENIALASAAKGRDADIALLPDSDDPHLVARVTFKPRPEGPAEDPLYEQIPHRCTNRRPTMRPSLNPMHVQVLMAAARQQGVRLQLCQDRAALAKLGHLLGEIDRLHLLAEHLRRDYFDTLRWSHDQVQARRDGLDVSALELGPVEHFLRLLSQPAVASIVSSVGGGSLFTSTAIQALTHSAAVGLLSIEGTTPITALKGGRALQHIWLTATALGLGVHPWNTPINLFARIERYHGAKLARDEVQTLTELRDEFTRFFTVSLADTELMLFRLSYADPPEARSLRRPVDAILTFETESASSVAPPSSSPHPEL